MGWKHLTTEDTPELRQAGEQLGDAIEKYISGEGSGKEAGDAARKWLGEFLLNSRPSTPWEILRARLRSYWWWWKNYRKPPWRV